MGWWLRWLIYLDGVVVLSVVICKCQGDIFLLLSLLQSYLIINRTCRTNLVSVIKSKVYSFCKVDLFLGFSGIQFIDSDHNQITKINKEKKLKHIKEYSLIFYSAYSLPPLFYKVGALIYAENIFF